MNVYNTGILIHSDAKLTVNPGKCKLTPPYRPISQISNPRKNQMEPDKRKTDLGTNLLTVPWNSYILHFKHWVKSMRQSWYQGCDRTPPFLFLWKSQCSMHCKIYLILFPFPSKSGPGSAQQQKKMSQHPPFSVICSKLEFPWTTFRALAIFTGAQSNRHHTCNYCFLLYGVGWLWATFHLPSRSSTTASQLAAQVVKARTHVLLSSSHLSLVYIGR